MFFSFIWRLWISTIEIRAVCSSWIGSRPNWSETLTIRLKMLWSRVAQQEGLDVCLMDIASLTTRPRKGQWDCHYFSSIWIRRSLSSVSVNIDRLFLFFPPFISNFSASAAGVHLDDESRFIFGKLRMTGILPDGPPTTRSTYEPDARDLYIPKMKTFTADRRTPTPHYSKPTSASWLIFPVQSVYGSGTWVGWWLRTYTVEFQIETIK